MDMVVKKYEEMWMEMLEEVELIRDQTRGELTGAATQMRSVQEALVGPVDENEQGRGSDYQHSKQEQQQTRSKRKT